MDPYQTSKTLGLLFSLFFPVGLEALPWRSNVWGKAQLMNVIARFTLLTIAIILQNTLPTYRFGEDPVQWAYANRIHIEATIAFYVLCAMTYVTGVGFATGCLLTPTDLKESKRLATLRKNTYAALA